MFSSSYEGSHEFHPMYGSSYEGPHHSHPMYEAEVIPALAKVLLKIGIQVGRAAPVIARAGVSIGKKVMTKASSIVVQVGGKVVAVSQKGLLIGGTKSRLLLRKTRSFIRFFGKMGPTYIRRGVDKFGQPIMKLVSRGKHALLNLSQKFPNFTPKLTIIKLARGTAHSLKKVLMMAKTGQKVVLPKVLQALYKSSGASKALRKSQCVYIIE